eukprot:13652802-Alexandrium_andersonii.AAC.1
MTLLQRRFVHNVLRFALPTDDSMEWCLKSVKDCKDLLAALVVPMQQGDGSKFTAAKVAQPAEAAAAPAPAGKAKAQSKKRKAPKVAASAPAHGAAATSDGAAVTFMTDVVNSV